MNQATRLRDYILATARQMGIFEKAKDYYNLSLPLLVNPTHSRSEVIAEKSLQASWLYVLAATSPAKSKSLGFMNKNEFYSEAIEQLKLESKNENWSSWKCNTIKGLIKRLTPFHKAHLGKHTLESAFEILLSGKHDNVNAQKLGIRQQLHIIEIHRKTEDPNYIKTHRIYSVDMRALTGIGIWHPNESEITLSAMKAFLKKPDVVQILKQNGKLRIKNIF